MWKKLSMEDVLYKQAAPFYEALYRRNLLQRGGIAQECDRIEKIILNHGLAVQSILDMGCGTGVHAIELANRGYEVLAADFAREMLSLAQERPRAKNARITFQQADMRSFIPLKKYDAIICMTNAFLCNPLEENVESTLRCFSQTLRQGGVLLIEASCYQKSIEKGEFANTYVDNAVVDGREVTEISENTADEKKGVLTEHNTYFISRGDGTFEKHYSENQLRLLSMPQLEKALKKNGFALAELIDADENKPATEETTEYLIVARKLGE